ncbi:putative zinc finger A20 and AN1 domain-containing stress-associated protein 8 [Tanacetum coccineum]
MTSMKEELDQSTTPPLCKTGCGFYVDKETGDFCSSCYKSNEVVKKRNRCHVCNKRVGLVPFLCRCGESFCGLHRMLRRNMRVIDFKAAGRVVLEKHNPRCVADKLEFRKNKGEFGRSRMFYMVSKSKALSLRGRSDNIMVVFGRVGELTFE